MKSAKAYIAILSLAALVMMSCGKQSSSPGPARYTSEMAGMHHCTGEVTTWHEENQLKMDTITSSVSDSFSVTVINDLTITIGSSTLSYIKGNDSEIIFYETDFELRGLGFTTDTVTVTYNYLANKIEYDDISDQDGSFVSDEILFGQ